MEPTLDQIIEATGGTLSRDEQSVIVGYGPLGYLRLTPDSVISNGVEFPAVCIAGRLSRQNGGKQADLRKVLEAAGLRIR